MTQFEERIKSYVERYEVMNHRKPFLYQISEALGTGDKQVARKLYSLYPRYPDKLIVGKKAKELFDSYESGMTMMDLSEKTGVSYLTINSHREGMEKLGARFKAKNGRSLNLKKQYVRKDLSGDAKLVGVKVTSGMYKGMFGYLDEDLKVVLHIGGKPCHVRIDSLDYKEI